MLHDRAEHAANPPGSVARPTRFLAPSTSSSSLASYAGRGGVENDTESVAGLDLDAADGERNEYGTLFGETEIFILLIAALLSD